MKLKKISIIGSVILFFLLIVVALVLYNSIGPGAKDIKSSRNFMAKLYSINAVSNEQSLDDIQYKRNKILSDKNELVHKSIVTQNFGIDLDKNNNIIGFAKKEIPANKTKIDIQDAKALAEKYIDNIYNEEVILKSINTNEDSKSLPYYSFIYTKQKNGYPFYFDEIKLNIDKENGFLDGYSNSAVQRECKEPKINITNEEAEKIALEAFRKYNKEGTVRNDETHLVYTDNKGDKEANSIYELCYALTVDGKNDKGKNISWKIFVSCENSNVLNILKDGAEKEVMAN
jgi:hypothetical protein